MRNNDRLESKIQRKIKIWFVDHGDEFIICIKEFCQGNRTSLTLLMKMLEDLGSDVFADGKSLDIELLEDLEYRIFELIGLFSDISGGRQLLDSINKNIIPRLTVIFAEAKRLWNLHNYKITRSIEVLDPDNSLIAEIENAASEDTAVPIPDEVREQARNAIDRLVLFAKRKFRGEKNRKIAVSWLENPEKASDIRWLASLAESSEGSTKVTLTRIKKSLAKYHNLRRENNRLILSKSSLPLRQNRCPMD